MNQLNYTRYSKLHQGSSTFNTNTQIKTINPNPSPTGTRFGFIRYGGGDGNVIIFVLSDFSLFLATLSRKSPRYSVFLSSSTPSILMAHPFFLHNSCTSSHCYIFRPLVPSIPELLRLHLGQAESAPQHIHDLRLCIVRQPSVSVALVDSA